MNTKSEPINIISMGAGVQSTVMALLAARENILPMPAAAIFADTQFEPKAIYEHLDWLESQLPFPVYRVTNGNLRDDHLSQSKQKRIAASMPTFSLVVDKYGREKSGGMRVRHCTTDYKIKPIFRKTREILGLKRGQKAPKEIAVRQWIGISTDEAVRMKPAKERWVESVYPLVEIGFSRNDCIRWFSKNYPGRKLAKSSCIGCPFHNDTLWRDMKINDPVSFQEAINFDNQLRSSGIEDRPRFLHRSCKPLEAVDFSTVEDVGQINMFNNECEGMCGV